MRDFQKNKFWRRVANSPAVIILLVVLLVWLARPLWQLYNKNRLVTAEHESLLSEVRRLEARKADLTVEVNKLATDRGVEEAIRENFDVVGPGEQVINFLPFEDSATSSAPAQEPPWWLRLLNRIDTTLRNS